MDVIAMHQAGFKNAVASLGTSLTPEQCEIIKHFKKNVIVMYDSDAPGRNAAKRAVSILKKAGIMSRVCLLPDAYNDPDELIKAGGHALVSSVLAHSIDGEFFYLRSLDIKERARELFRLDDDKVRKYLSESKKQEKNLQNISR